MLSVMTDDLLHIIIAFIFATRVPIGEAVVDPSDRAKDDETVIKISNTDQNGFVFLML